MALFKALFALKLDALLINYVATWAREDWRPGMIQAS